MIDASMRRNVEIKARIKNLKELEERIAAIADSGPVYIDQDDTFFNCRSGYLKLRKFSAAKGELIHYRRDGNPGPRKCEYMISETTDPDNLKILLTVAFGEMGTVIKRRTLYMIGKTRIHLDLVEGLGEFIELEVVLSQQQSVSEGRDIVESLMKRLGINVSDLIERPYIDLIGGE